MPRDEMTTPHFNTHADTAEAPQPDALAAQRLDRAFNDLERRIHLLQEQVDGTPDLEILEQENRELHNALVNEQSQNANLREMVKALNKQLEEAAARIERLNESVTKEQDAA